MTLFCPHAHSATTFANEYQLKAVFLYNFANFINWPSTAFADENSPFLICVLGDDPFQEDLDLTIEDQEARGRALEVARFEGYDEVAPCHILFISESQQFNLAEIYRFTCQYPILT
ncbi:MAG: YfiR family protein, partial [Kangiellaceae bacterium]|nr:YfiR family protein [Kangiellaceae bacterium]